MGEPPQTFAELDVFHQSDCRHTTCRFEKPVVDDDALVTRTDSRQAGAPIHEPGHQPQEPPITVQTDVESAPLRVIPAAEMAHCCQNFRARRCIRVHKPEPVPECHRRTSGQLVAPRPATSCNTRQPLREATSTLLSVLPPSTTTHSTPASARKPASRRASAGASLRTGITMLRRVSGQIGSSAFCKRVVAKVWSAPRFIRRTVTTAGAFYAYAHPRLKRPIREHPGK